jgi:transposase
MFFDSHGVRIERVLTDRALTYTRSNHFAEAVASLPARHLTTKPYRPQTNGKVERFIQTMLREWAYSRLYTSNEERLNRLPRWLQLVLSQLLVQVLRMRDAAHKDTGNHRNLEGMWRERLGGGATAGDRSADG